MKRTNLGIWFLVLTATAALIALTVPYETQLPTSAAVTTSFSAHTRSSTASMLGEFDPLEDCDPWVDVQMQADQTTWQEGITCNSVGQGCDPCPEDCWKSLEKTWEIEAGKRSATVGNVTGGGETYSTGVIINETNRACAGTVVEPNVYDNCCFTETVEDEDTGSFKVTFDEDTCVLTLNVSGVMEASVDLDNCTNKMFTPLVQSCGGSESWSIDCDKNGFSFQYTCQTDCDSVARNELVITGSVHVNLLDFEECDLDSSMVCDCADFDDVLTAFDKLIGPGVGCSDDDREVMLLCHYIACVKDEAGWDCTDLEWIIECIEDLLGCGLGGNLVELIAECLGGCDPDCCVEFMSTGLYYRQCGEDFKCDQNCDGEIDCDDLTIFVMDSLACNGFVITREQMFELVRIYLSNCTITADFCENLHDCLEQLLLDIFGSGEPKPVKYELIGTYDAADCCDCRVTENGTPYDHGGDCEAFLCDRVADWGVVDCEDLKQFLADSKVCNDNVDFTDAELAELICLFLEECPDAFLDENDEFDCEAFKDCVLEIFFGPNPQETWEDLPEDVRVQLEECSGCLEMSDPCEMVHENDGGVPDCPTPQVGGSNNEGNNQGTDQGGVNVAQGDKNHAETHMSVATSGQDYQFNAQYSSDPEHPTMDDCVGPLGAGWWANDFIWVKTETGVSTTTAKVQGPMPFYYEWTEDSGSYPSDVVFTHTGPHTQEFVETTVTLTGGAKFRMYRLREPGQWEWYFYAPFAGDAPNGVLPTPAHLEGQLHKRVDEYGNTWAYGYDVYYGSSSDVAKLSTIEITAADGTKQARIKFKWVTSGDDFNIGRLKKSSVYRYAPGQTEPTILTQEVEYLYMEDGASGMSADLGTTGDLVQIIRRERIDRDTTQSTSGPVWRTRIWQYRYHGGTGASSGVTGRGYTWAGNQHQMKMIIHPEQIEYATQVYNESNTPKTVEAYATDLLNTADDAVLYVDTNNVYLADLASTVLETYEDWDEMDPVNYPGRVTRQYQLSACGCSGGATQGVRLDYSHIVPNGAGQDEWAMKVVESVKNGGSYDYHRTIFYNSLRQGPVGNKNSPPYLVHMAIHDDDDEDGTIDMGEHVWAQRFEYSEDDDHNLLAVYSPASIDDYTPNNGTTESSVTKNTTGLANRFTYASTHNRREKTYVKKGSSATEYLVSEVTWGSGSGSEREHLPKTIKRFRVEGDTTTANNIETTQFAYGFHTSGADNVGWVETTVEAELESENGPGGNYVSYELFDVNGRNIASRAADTALTLRTFQATTGRVKTITRNGEVSDLPSGAPYSSITGYGSWTDRHSSGGSLTSEYMRDPLGRVQERVNPSLVSTYTLRELRTWPERSDLTYYAEVTLPHTWIEGMTETYDGPATVTWYDAGNSVIGTSDFEIGVDGYGGAQIGSYGLVISDWDEGDELARSAIHHHLSGLVESTEVWHDLANDGSYTTTYEYDSLGRNATVIDPLGTYTQTTYDVLNRTTKVEVGTSDVNLVTVAEYFYDSGGTTTSGVGNGNLTLMRAHVDDSNDRDVIHEYDWRDRAIKTTNELPPNQFVVYDNLGRVVEEAIFETTGSTWTNLTDIDDATTRADRGMYKKTAYSQRGMVYAQSIAIDPTVATGSMTFLENHRWFDQVGRTIGSWGPNNQAAKNSFDGLGRPTSVYITDRGGDVAPGASGNHADVYDASNFVAKVNGDVVFEEYAYRYIVGSTPGAHAGMLDLATTYRRSHDTTDSDTGALSSLASPKSIKTFTASFFDGANRVIRSVNYGTNQSGFVHGGGAPTVNQSSPPAVDPDDATKLVTATVYNVRGLVDTTEDPSGQFTKYFYDDLYRSIAVAENYDDATVTWNGTDDCWEVGNIDDAELDTDRVTSFVYDGGNNVTIQIAHQPDNMDADDPQKTVYTYGVTKGAGATDSRINHNGFLKEAKYPDSAGGTDVMTYAYTRLGETRWVQDQQGSTHTYTRDALGRVTQDEGVKGGGTDIDDTFDTIAIAYDDLGRASEIKTLKKSDGSAANGIKFEYTKLWQISKVWQDVDGDNFTTSPNVQYGYSTQAVGSGNYSRQNHFTYPLGQGFDVKFLGTSNGRISRATGIANDTSIDPNYQEVGYEYIGLGMVATVDYADPDVQLDYQVAHNGERVAGSYNGFDRFGRVIHHPWVDGAFDEHATLSTVPNIPPIVEIEHAYDHASNRLTARDVRPGSAQANRDSLYTYDGLDRLSKAERGVVTFNGTSGEWEVNSYSTGSQSWSLDMLGNWSGFGTDTTGDGAYSSANEQTNRAHNDVNELTGIDLDGNGSMDLSLTYDAAGNLRERPINTSGASERYTHDLWNRLVKVETYVSSTWYSIGEYEYFGNHWRSVKRADTDSDQTLDEKRELYYSAGWQLLEERVDDDYVSNPGVDRHLQNLWGLRYIDDMVWHREDANGDEDFLDGGDARWWHLTDTQFSTVAILDDAANLQERVKYDAYGKAMHHRWRDVDGDRDYDSADRTIVSSITFGANNLIGQANYRAEADLDRDGDVDTTDLSIADTNYESALAPGVLSDSIVKNTIGWDGYVFNPETTQNGGGLYTVRFRSYSTELGRWLERDPQHYSESMSLYLYSIAVPLGRLDPFGAASCAEPPGAKPPWYARSFQALRSILKKPAGKAGAIGAAIAGGLAVWKGDELFYGKKDWTDAQLKELDRLLQLLKGCGGELSEAAQLIEQAVEEGDVYPGALGDRELGFTPTMLPWYSCYINVTICDEMAREPKPGSKSIFDKPAALWEADIKLMSTILHELLHKYDGASELEAYLSELDFLDSLSDALEAGGCLCESDESAQALREAIQAMRMSIENTYKEHSQEDPGDYPPYDFEKREHKKWSLPKDCPSPIEPLPPGE